MRASAARPWLSRRRPRAAGMSTVPTPAWPPFLWQQVKHGLRLAKLTGLNSDIGQHGRGETQPRREVSFLQHPQRDPGRGVGLGQRADAAA